MSIDVAATPEPGADASARFGRTATVAALTVGVFMSALDGSIVNAVLPVVAAAFDADVAAIEWVVTAYLLVQGGLLLTFGRLGDMWGHKKLYLVGLAGFVAARRCAASPRQHGSWWPC